MRARHSIVLLLLSLLLAATAATSRAATIDVATSGDLNVAVRDAVDGDVIRLAAGHYTWVDVRQITQGITLQGATGQPGDVVIDLALAADAILSRATFAGAAPVLLAGLTLSGYQAPAVMLEAPAELHLSHCVLSANAGGYPTSGGLIDGGGGLVDLQDVTLSGNTARFLVNSQGGQVALQRVVIDANSGDLGLFGSNAQLSLADVTATGNAVTHVIEAYGGSLSLDRSSLSGNQAGTLYLADVAAVVSATTFADNLGSHSIELSALSGTFAGTDLDVREPQVGDPIVIGPGWHATFEQCSFAGGTLYQGWVLPLADAAFRCCELDLSRWRFDGTYSVNNDGCSVPAETTSFGSLKAMFR